MTPPPPPKEVDQAPTVERFCRSKFPDHYAALAVGKDQESLIVYRRPLDGFDAAVRRQFPHLAISFQDARYSHRELTAAVQRIVADTGYWRERGVEIQGCRTSRRRQQRPRHDVGPGAGTETAVAALRSGGHRPTRGERDTDPTI